MECVKSSFHDVVSSWITKLSFCFISCCSNATFHTYSPEHVYSQSSSIRYNTSKLSIPVSIHFSPSNGIYFCSGCMRKRQIWIFMYPRQRISRLALLRRSSSSKKAVLIILKTTKHKEVTQMMTCTFTPQSGQKAHDKAKQLWANKLPARWPENQP